MGASISIVPNHDPISRPCLMLTLDKEMLSLAFVASFKKNFHTWI